MNKCPGKISRTCTALLSNTPVKGKNNEEIFDLHDGYGIFMLLN